MPQIVPKSAYALLYIGWTGLIVGHILYAFLQRDFIVIVPIGINILTYAYSLLRLYDRYYWESDRVLEPIELAAELPHIDYIVPFICFIIWVIASVGWWARLVSQS